MYLTTKGLVLRSSNYNDTDALLTILTHTHGKITVKARGLRRKNSPLAAACQLLSYSDFVLFENRGFYTINEAHTVEQFQSLRCDLQKLSLGTYFAQAAEVLSQEDMPNPELLSLVLNCMYAISKLCLPEQLVKAVFELRSACLAGYEPDLQACHRCGNTSPDRFNISEGHLECSNCGHSDSDGIRMPVTAGAIEAMRYICFCNSKQLFSFQVGDISLQCLADISESYLSLQLERGFSSLDFYKSLLVDIRSF